MQAVRYQTERDGMEELDALDAGFAVAAWFFTASVRVIHVASSSSSR